MSQEITAPYAQNCGIIQRSSSNVHENVVIGKQVAFTNGTCLYECPLSQRVSINQGAELGVGVSLRLPGRSADPIVILSGPNLSELIWADGTIEILDKQHGARDEEGIFLPDCYTLSPAHGLSACCHKLEDDQVVCRNVSVREDENGSLLVCDADQPQSSWRVIPYLTRAQLPGPVGRNQAA